MICLESLAMKNMVKNRHLAKAIGDMGGELAYQLHYKAEWAGRQFVADTLVASAAMAAGLCWNHCRSMSALTIVPSVAPKASTVL